MKMKILFSSLVLSVLVLTACNPSKRLNQAVVERNKTAAENAKIIMPTLVSTPDNINMVYDYESLYTPAQQKQLDTLLRNFEKSNLVAIQLITLTPAAMQNPDFDANNGELYKAWDKSHGGAGRTMVLGLSVQQQKSKMDYGPYAAKFISDEKINAIISDNRRYFEQGEYFKGTWEGLNQIMDEIRKNVKL